MRLWLLSLTTFFLAALATDVDDCFAQPVAPPTEKNRTSETKSFLQAQYDEGKFNGVVLVAEKGEIKTVVAHGDATIDAAPLSVDSVFRLASVSKAFTAMSITMLRDQGKLKFDDNVRKHIPEFPYPDVTIRHLLHHTSGLPDYVALLNEHWDVETKHKPSERKIARSPDALKMLIEHKPKIHFAPGEKYEYSNTGYITLGLIVQQVSGQPFEDFLKTRIFAPLKMNNTLLFNPLAAPEIVNRAYGFKERNGKLIPKDHDFLNGMFGDGEVYSNVRDLLKWDQSLYTDSETKLVSAESLQEIFTPGKLNDGSEVGYGLGWGIDDEAPHRVSHGGGWLGFQTHIERDRKSRRTLIVLTNDSSPWFGEIKKTLKRMVFEK